MISLRVKPLGLLLAAAMLALSASADAQERLVLSLEHEEAYGSGPSVMENLYKAGGLEVIGLFVGNPNTLNRGDRVLLRYDLEPLLLLSGTISNATLTMGFSTYASSEDQIEVEVSCFNTAPEALAGRLLNDADMESLATFTVTAGDTGASARIFEVDVTEALKGAAAKGAVAIAFRLRAPGVEEGSNTMEPSGVIVSTAAGQLPELIVDIAKEN